MVNHMKRFIQEDEGATALEYGLLAALIAAVIVGSVTALGTTLDGTFSGIDGKIAAS